MPRATEIPIATNQIAAPREGATPFTAAVKAYASTFSYLAAGMHPSATGHHWMVHPGVFERCVRASSPYSSLAQSERRFITTPSFSILGVRRMGFALPVCRPCRLSDMLTARVQS